MPRKKVKLFDITTRGEWLRQSGTDYTPPKLNARRVPQKLRPLIPLAARWGIADDFLRGYKLSLLSEPEFMHLYYQIRRQSGALQKFVANACRFDPKDWTKEESCFLYLDKCYCELSASAYWILKKKNGRTSAEEKPLMTHW